LPFLYVETFEKYSVLFKVKPPARKGSPRRGLYPPACKPYRLEAAPEGKAKISTTGILEVFRGLKFEADAEIGQKRAFCKGLILKAILSTAI